MTLPSGLVVMQCIVPSSNIATRLTTDNCLSCTQAKSQQATIVRSTQDITQSIPFTKLVSEQFNVSINTSC